MPKSTPKELLRARKQYEENPQAANQARMERRRRALAEIKEALYAFLGGVCTTCGHDDPAALTLVRTNGTPIGNYLVSNQVKFLRELQPQIEANREAYALQCWNCKRKYHKSVGS